jgi:hypothetical protein
MVEEGFFPLDTHLRAGNGGLIDLLAVDTSGALAIVEIDRSGEDDLLRRSLEHQGWVGTQLHFLRRLYGPEKIHPFHSPRAILLSTRYSEPFLEKVADLPVPITPLVYQLSPSGQPSVVRLEAAKPDGARGKAAPGTAVLPGGSPGAGNQAPPTADRLSPEELDAFYRFERRRLKEEDGGAVKR